MSTIGEKYESAFLPRPIKLNGIPANSPLWN